MRKFFLLVFFAVLLIGIGIWRIIEGGEFTPIVQGAATILAGIYNAILAYEAWLDFKAD
jgi:hypothetical protein